ncbi:hypothetical protein ABLE68_19320 [Nocardioides sp. CN2-186]|uniref:hypothetical protein n=1 Tax=Nocardioides tweenelious TaxID=3156607 RepID=UPI0032B54110
MATPERRTAPGTPVVHTAPASASGPVPVLAPFGWVLILVSGIGLILASWLLYGNEASGMWAGYWAGIIGTVVVLAAMALNTSLPEKPTLALLGLCGVLLILFALFLDDEQVVVVTELLAGIGLLAGVGLRVVGTRS